MNDSRKIPEALGDEDGERYYLMGHIDPPMAVLSVIVYHMAYTDADSAYDLVLGGPTRHREGEPLWSWTDQLAHADSLLGSVEHFWSKPSADDEDFNVRCDETDPEAEPWTMVTLP